MARPVFPEGNGFQSLTPEDVSKGYRVWTDRKKVPLIGKFVATKSKNVVIEVNGEEKEYPKAGLSEADQTWVNNEVRRRAEEAAAARQAASSNAGDSGTSRFPFPGSTFPRSPRFGGAGDMGHGEDYADNTNSNPGSRSPFGMGGHDDGSSNRFGSGGLGRSRFPTIEYTFTCDHCGKTWTDSSSISQCSDCKDKYQFQCTKCGHKWTRTGTMIDTCPRCSNGGVDPGSFSASSVDYSSGSGSSSSSSSGAQEGQGVFLTILYVCMGLGVLGGIAGGLFKAFG
jgi:hypothetical protein